MAFWKPSRPKSVEPPVMVSPAPPAMRAKPATVQRAAPKAPNPARNLPDDNDEGVDPRERGFDPYNSGAFNRKDTWSKVDRKK